MTFTYGGDLTDDVDFVRFKPGDTDSPRAYLTDEVIESLLATESSRQHAVLAAVGYIITQLSRPDFKADWLQVSNASARGAYESLLKRLEREFGVKLSGASMRATAVNTYRGDSETVTEPNYEGGRPGEGEGGDSETWVYSTEYTARKRRSEWLL